MVKEIRTVTAGYEGELMYSIGHWGMFPVGYYHDWLPVIG
jgi:hypothetical protein